MNEREEVCDELKQMVVKEKDKEEERFLNWILERIPGCEEIGFVPIIHDMNWYFLNYRNENLPQEEKKRENEIVRKDKSKSKRTNSLLETQSFPPQSSRRSNAMRFIV
jgi:GTP-dependent phosphoenolpyruvate carboxykinase